MSDFDDFSDNDDDFIALTLRPARTQQQTQVETLADTSDIVDSGLSNAELQAAKGEIAILRSKLSDMERSNKHEKDQMIVSNQNSTVVLESKISSLESTVRRLEDERKFLSVEVKNLSNRKKRKTLSSEEDTDVHMEDSNITMPSAASVTPPIINASVPSAVPAPIKFISQIANDNVMFIDNLDRHSITGLKHTTLEFLSKIGLTESFQFESFTIPSEEPISVHLLKFLNDKKNILRLDQLIQSFVQLLIHLIKSIIETGNERLYLPIPFLLSLLHNSVIFRPSAVTKDLTLTIISFNLDVMRTSDSVLRPKEFFGELYERHEKIRIKVIHIDLLKKLIFFFSFEIIEVLMVNLSQFNDSKFNHMVLLKFDSQFKELNKLIFSTNSSINIISIMVNIINCMLNSYEDTDENVKLPLMTQVVMDHLLKILNNGIPLKQGWFFTGLNKLIGNDQDNESIFKLIDWNLKINKYPQILYPLEDYEEFDTLNKHEFHQINLNFQILSIIEKLIINGTSKNEEPSIKYATFLKVIVLSIAKQQQFNMIRPKSNLSHLRSKYISKLIRILNLFWESTMVSKLEDPNMENQNDDDITMSPLLPTEVTQMLMVVLSRVAFSNNATTEEAAEFLLKMRSIRGNRKIPIYNKFTEAKAREVNHFNNVNERDLDIQELVDGEVAFSNGVEFAYDVDVVELARDMVEKFTTMNEADSLYSAMNS